MVDTDVNAELGPAEAMAARHKAEKKELLAKVQGLKKVIPKGDKRKNKEVKAQIVVLENELEKRHNVESMELNESLKSKSEDSSENGPKDCSKDCNEGAVVEAAPVSRVSKAQKKRDKKALKAKQHAEIVARAEEEYVNTQKYAEEEKIRKLLAELKLEVKPMVSDGNCLYYAVEDQLRCVSETLGYSAKELRKLTADYMLSHADDFMPFLTSPTGDDCMTRSEFETYCRDVAETLVWGGQLELRALSNVLRAAIHIIQADSPVVKIGEEHGGTPIILTYHHHELGLGEHYNSVRPLREVNVEDR